MLRVLQRQSMFGPASLLLASAMATSAGLLDLPIEILQHILTILSTPSFVQLSISCKALFELAANSRGLILHHLQSVPGIKIGLDDPTVPTHDLFLLFRQRASKHLYGTNFTADCLELRSRNTCIDPDASDILRLTPGYSKMSLVMKNSQTLRMYNDACSLTETKPSPFCGGKVTVLQVAHGSTYAAVLYQWEPEDKQKMPPWIEKPLVLDHPYKKPNSFPPAIPPASDSDDKFAEEDKEPPKVKGTKLFHLQFFNFNSADKRITYTLTQHENLVPRHLAISSKLLWAILWDVEGAKLPTEKCKIIQYDSYTWRPLLPGEEDYDSRVIWPTDFDPRPPAPSTEDIDKGVVVKRPTRISFFKEGRRLRLYAPGDIVPYKVISTGISRESRYPTNAISFENQTTFHVNTSFFGMHESWWDADEAQQVCRVSYLCLGVGDVWHGTGNCKTLCVLLASTKADHDDCVYSVELNRMNHVSAENCKAVARLWGWQNTSSTLTGLETVAVSHRGTRIAIAQWNRVLVWSLDPKMLCEEIVDFDIEEDGKHLKRKKGPRTESVAEGFYERVNDKLMGWKIANLKPIVIDLDGAVARKMSWTIQCENAEVEADHNSGDNSSIEAEASTNHEEDLEVSQDHYAGVVIGNDALSDAYNEHRDSTVDSETIASEKRFVEQEQIIVNGRNQATIERKYIVNDGNDRVVIEYAEVDGKEEIVIRNKLAPNEDESSEAEMEEAIDSTDSRQQQQVANADASNNSSVRAGTKRRTSTGDPQPPHLTVQDKQTIASKPDAEFATKHDAMRIVEQNSKGIVEPFQSVDAESIPQVIVETLPSVPDKPISAPKGKEKEIDVEQFEASRLPFPPKEGRFTGKGRRTNQYEKRFTEDELVILTDRGIQIWNLGAWGKGIRKRQWLEEQQTYV